MAIDSLSPIASTPGSAASSLGLQDFLRILLTQLSFQDPLKPMDNQEFMAQIAQFTSLEQTQQLNDKMDRLIANQAAMQSVGLIGRTVDISSGGSTFTGTVASLSLQADSPLISVSVPGGSVIPDIALSQILAVR